jgi:hypothetical protein
MFRLTAATLSISIIMSLPRVALTLLFVLHSVSVISGGGGCNLFSCFPNYDRNAPRRLDFTMLFRTFDADLSQGCGNLDTMNSCVRDFRQKCAPVTNETAVKLLGIWDRAQKGINYICRDQKQVFSNHRACLSSASMKTGVQKCQDILDKKSLKRRFARHSCSNHEDAVNCLTSLGEKECPRDGIPQKITQMVENFADVFLDHEDHCSHEHSSGGQQRLAIASSLGMFLSTVLASFLL